MSHHPKYNETVTVTGEAYPHFAGHHGTVVDIGTNLDGRLTYRIMFDKIGILWAQPSEILKLVDDPCDEMIPNPYRRKSK